MTSPAIDSPISTISKRGTLSLPAWLVLVCVITFTVLLGVGVAIWKNAPPIPEHVRSPQQEIILTATEIQAGQETYLARGGQDIGSIWGHGGYLAPDWSADFLHRWGLATAGSLYAHQADFSQADLEALPTPERASLEAKVKEQFKTNSYDPQTKELTLTTAQTQGLQKVFQDYHNLLANGSEVHSIPSGWFTDETQIRNVTAFFAWTAWAAAVNRPGAPFSYTANWPHDDLIGNQAPPQFVKSLKMSQAAEGFYRWPLRFFIATCFWNLVGAGVFGFLVNPPIVLYYAQGLNTTPIHAHSALFGVYGNLALALMLFSLRDIVPERVWNEKYLRFSFWAINGGLAAMVVFALIPSGFYQLVVSVNHGTWYARSAETVSSFWMRAFVWSRLPGDILFGLGVLVIAVFVLRAIAALFRRPIAQSGQSSTLPES